MLIETKYFQYQDTDLHGVPGFYHEVHELQQSCSEMTVSYPIFNTNAERYLFAPQVDTNDNWASLVKPFSFDVWCMCLMSFIAVMCLFMFVYDVYSRFPREQLVRGCKGDLALKAHWILD